MSRKDKPIEIQTIGAGEMAQRVRALTAPPKVPSSNPSNHMVAHNHP
jgi:stage V sporulation protein SpoVS